MNDRRVFNNKDYNNFFMKELNTYSKVENNIKKNIMGYTLFYALCFYYVYKGFNLSKLTGISLFLLNQYIQYVIIRQRLNQNKESIRSLLIMKKYLRYRSPLDLLLYV